MPDFPKLEITIPDIWFDFIGRLSPGIVFIGLVRVFLLSNTTTPSFQELFVCGIAAYIVPLLFQPLASTINWTIFKSSDKQGGDEIKKLKKLYGDNFGQRIFLSYGPERREVLLCSKMQAEITFFSQLIIMIFIFIIALVFFKDSIHSLAQNNIQSSSMTNYIHWDYLWILFGPIYLWFSGLLIANRRLKRLIDMAEHLKTIGSIPMSSNSKLNEAGAAGIETAPGK